MAIFTFPSTKTQGSTYVLPQFTGAQIHLPPFRPLKMLRAFDPIKISPFVVPTIRNEAPTGNTPMGVTPLQAVTNRFPLGVWVWKPLSPMTPQKPPSVHQ